MTRYSSKLGLVLALVAGLFLASSAQAGHRDDYVGFTYVDRDSGFAIHLGGGDRYDDYRYYDSHYYRPERRHYRRHYDRYDRRSYYRDYRQDRRHSRHHRRHDRHDHYDRHYRHDRRYR